MLMLSDTASHGGGAAGAASPEARDGLMRAYEIADGRLERDDLAWLAHGFKAYLASNGSLPLERCLHLPSGDRALRRARRDYWLRLAWARMAGDVSPWRRSEMLAGAIHRFRAAKWPRWRSLGVAPVSAGLVENALFEAFRSCERIPATAMQIHNITIQA